MRAPAGRRGPPASPSPARHFTVVESGRQIIHRIPEVNQLTDAVLAPASVWRSNELGARTVPKWPRRTNQERREDFGDTLHRKFTVASVRSPSCAVPSPPTLAGRPTRARWCGTSVSPPARQLPPEKEALRRCRQRPAPERVPTSHGARNWRAAHRPPVRRGAPVSV